MLALCSAEQCGFVSALLNSVFCSLQCSGVWSFEVGWSRLVWCFALCSALSAVDLKLPFSGSAVLCCVVH